MSSSRTSTIIRDPGPDRPGPARTGLELADPKSPDSNPTGPELWCRAAPVHAFPENAGVCVKLGTLQIAVFNLAGGTEWYACQNLCPHRQEMALSRGLVGSSAGVPKVACPFHKSTFDLTTGECLNADLETLTTYPVRVDDGHVFIGLRRRDLEAARLDPGVEGAPSRCGGGRAG